MYVDMLIHGLTAETNNSVKTTYFNLKNECRYTDSHINT